MLVCIGNHFRLPANTQILLKLVTLLGIKFDHHRIALRLAQPIPIILNRGQSARRRRLPGSDAKTNTAYPAANNRRGECIDDNLNRCSNTHMPQIILGKFSIDPDVVDEISVISGAPAAAN